MELVDDAYETKMAAFEVDCNDGKGEPIACHHVGEFYSVVKDAHDRAAKVYERNCYEKEYGPSCFNLGRLFLAGKGVPQSDAKAEDHFGRACAQKHLQSCYHQAIMMYGSCTGESSPAASTSVKSTPSSSAATAAATTVSPVVLSEKEKKEKLQKALGLFEWACKEGEYESCYFVGAHFLDQKRAERDPVKAVEFLKRSCASNHGPSCYNLAVLYRRGDQGIPPNPELFEQYKELTNNLVKQFGAISGKRTA